MQIQAPGGLIFGGAIYGRFFALPDWGSYIWRGLYMEGLIFGILRHLPKHFTVHKYGAPNTMPCPCVCEYGKRDTRG